MKDEGFTVLNWMNGWQRIGIILSAAILITGAASGSQEDFGISALWVVGGWAGVYAAVGMFKWVRRGFQRTATPSK